MKLMIDDLYPSMPWDEIDTVVFDVGNVLLKFVPKLILERYVPEVPELHPALEQRIFRSPYWCMRDRGTATAAEAIEAMCIGYEDLRPYITRVVEQWVEMKDVIEEGVTAVKTCKAHGKKLYVLSNYADDAFAVVDEKYDFFRLFDGKVISSRLKLCKPESAIYRHIADTYGLDPARTLFIDDNIANIEAALNEGWHGLCYTRSGQLDAFFA